jgi:hypothetical protein
MAMRSAHPRTKSVWQRLQGLLAAQAHLMVLRSDMVGHLTRKRKLAERLLPVPHGKSLDRLAANFGGQRCDGVRIEATTQKYSQRHIIHQWLETDASTGPDTAPRSGRAAVYPRRVLLSVPNTRDLDLAAVVEL